MPKISAGEYFVCRVLQNQQKPTVYNMLLAGLLVLLSLA